jgi:hypothetical protein
METDVFLRRHNFITDVRGELPKHAAKVWRRRNPDFLVGMVWHHSATQGSVDAVARYHVGPNHISVNGLPGISYTFFIEPDGDVLLCNDLEAVTYSQGDRTKPGDENRMYLAVCFGGDFDAPGHNGCDAPTARQLYRGMELWFACRDSLGFESGDLFGHYHFGKANCPGTVLSGLIEAIRRDHSEDHNPAGITTMEGRQRALKALGFYEEALDGVWGVESRRALARYQASRGLVADGLWGPETERAILRDA